MKTALQHTRIFTLKSHALTDVGCVRQHNEDSYVEHIRANLWAVSDGMGGHSAGDYASARIVSLLGQIQLRPDSRAMVDQVIAHLNAANTDIYERAQKQNKTIGATVAASLVLQNKMICIWVGDSRIYRIQKLAPDAWGIEQLTADHTVTADMISDGYLTPEEAVNHPMNHVLSRAVGVEATLPLEIIETDLLDGDRILLCSDGLTGCVEDSQILEICAASRTPEMATNALIDTAKSAGASDNVTAICIFVGNPEIAAFTASEAQAFPSLE